MGNVAAPGGRAAKKAAAKHGTGTSASPSGGKPMTPTQLAQLRARQIVNSETPGGITVNLSSPKSTKNTKKTSTPYDNSAPDLLAQFIGSEDQSFVKKWNDPSPIYKPMLVPGRTGQQGVTAAVGYMFADVNATPDGQSKHNPFGFRFHYNPANISTSSTADINYTNMPMNDGGTQYFNNYGACSFQIMINRQDEVLAKTFAKHYVMGTNEFALLGTLYDLDWMYRVFNGHPGHQVGGVTLKNATLMETSMSYVLRATPVHVHFNQYLKFFGRPAEIDVQHVLFTAGMVPMVSTVTVTLMGLAQQGDNSVLANPTVTSGNGTKVQSGSVDQNGNPVRHGF